jgi:hypothetical protein
MIGTLLAGRQQFDVPCTIKVSNTFDSLHAHVELDGNLPIEPGDEVLVHGDPVIVPYGQVIELRRQATVTRASGIERLWTRLTGDLEFMELCEFSFSSGRKL